MAALCGTMMAWRSVNLQRVEAHDTRSTPVAELPKRMKYNSGSLGGWWIGDNHLRVVHAQPFLSRSSAMFPARAAVGTEEAVVEPVTGISFSKIAIVPGASEEFVLVGAGVREKKIAFLKVKVYAVGLYAASSLASSLGAWKEVAASEFERDDSFFQALIESPVDKLLRIVLARDVDGAQFWEALDGAVAPRLKAAGHGSEGDQALQSFGNVFKGRELRQGTQIYLTWLQPSKLQVAVVTEGAALSVHDASIDSRALLSCLFDVFLGKDSVSPSAKAAVARNLFSLI